jgi:hypothetical protein
MRSRSFLIALAVLIGVGSLLSPRILNRIRSAEPASASPRTPWGHPDFQGIWDSKTITPLQRPDSFAGREFLTEQEAAALEKEAARHPGEAERAEAAAEAVAQGATPFMEDVVGSCLVAFNYPGRTVVATRRTSLIVDPPDGKVPYLKSPTPAASPVPPQRTPVAPVLDNSGPSDNPEDRPAIERCLGVSLPCLGGLCPFSRIVQNRDYVSIYYEQGAGGGIFRNIPIDGRPHLPGTTRQWLGHSVGRWEGTTLVVDTTNFTSQTSFRGSRENLHLVERFDRIAFDQIRYTVTVEDPTQFSKPWTLELIMRKADEQRNEIYETACHEGNYSLTSSLAGARALDREKTGPPPSRKR